MEQSLLGNTDIYQVVRYKITGWNEGKEGQYRALLVEYPWDAMDTMRLSSEEVAVGLSSEGWVKSCLGERSGNIPEMLQEEHALSSRIGKEEPIKRLEKIWAKEAAGFV